MSVVVFGEMSMDLIIYTESNKHTVDKVLRGRNYLFSCGGHGANQAFSLSKLEVSTKIVGRLGNDFLSLKILDNLKSAGVDTKDVYIDYGNNSGLAILSVDESKDFIVDAFIEGVNKRVDSSDLYRFQSTLDFETKIAVFQLGYPTNIIIDAIKLCKSKDIITILDPTPVIGEFPKELYDVDYILPNEYEAEKITGIHVKDFSTAFSAAKKIHKEGVPHVIIKLGEQGSIYWDKASFFHIPAYSTNVSDTIGAGDAYLAGFIKGLLSGKDARASIVMATAYAALCCNGQGAQPNLLSLTRLLHFLEGAKTKE